MNKTELLVTRIRQLEEENRRLRGEVDYSKVAQLFLGKYEQVEKVVPHNHRWVDYKPHHPSESSLFYEQAVDGKYAVALAPGELAKAHSPDTDDRKVIFIGTRYGVVAVFPRYSNGEENSYMCTMARDLQIGWALLGGFYLGGKLGEEGMSMLLGLNGQDNIGQLIDQKMQQLTTGA